MHFSKPPSQKIHKLLYLAFQKRKRFYEFTNAVRLLNGKGDGLEGLTIDQYYRHFLVKVFDHGWDSWLNEVREILIQRFDPDCVVFKDASKSRPSSHYFYQDLILAKTDLQTVVTENGLRFLVDLEDNLNVGLFLDMRENRKIVGTLSKGKDVLNCFSYTCSFGVYCQSYGASGVVNVDISQKFLDKGARNYELNHLTSSKEEFVKKDVASYVSRALKKGNFFDVVILDPPSFSRYEGKVFSVQKDFMDLIDLVLQVLKPNASLFLSTNFAGISTAQLDHWIKKSAKQLERSIEEVVYLGQDRDFRGSGSMKESHLAALLVRLASFPST